ncbi:MAG: helix-turn-helix domain-containing protein [Thermonemataceae bacterium]
MLPKQTSIYQQVFTNARRHLNLSLRAMGKELAIHYSLLSKIETGKQRPGPKLIKRLPQMTGHSIAQLYHNDFTQPALQRSALTLASDPLALNLDKLNTVQKNYLRSKWLAEVKELTDHIAQRQQALAESLEKYQHREEAISTLQGTLQVQQAILTFLSDRQAAAPLLKQQENEVARLTEALAALQTQPGMQRLEEWLLAQVNLETLIWRKQNLTKKIGELENLLSS